MPTTNDDHENPTTPETSTTLATHLLAKCSSILSEVDTFQTLLAQTLRNPQLIEVRSLRSSIVSELRTLERLAKKIEDAIAAGDEDTEARNVHALRSSNLPFYEALWMIAKRSCTGLVAFGKRFSWDGGSCGGDGGLVLAPDDAGADMSVDTDVGEQEGEKGKGKGKGKGKKVPAKDTRKSVLVDIVADDGEEWVKVSTISENRLSFEMAEKGWEKDSDDEGEEGGGSRTVLRNDEDGNGDDDDDEVGLIKLAIDMRKVASATRVAYKHPKVRFVIPRIEEGKNSDIDDLLSVIRGHGITVESGGKYMDSQTPEGDEVALSHLLPTQFKRLTPSLNVDCTLLLAMVSDLSHYKAILPSPEHHTAINRQIEIEREHPLLLVEIWPATKDRELLCTDEAAKRMREIVDTIGTETEKERTKILMGDSPFSGLETGTLIQKFQELSDYQVPTQWKIPINVMEARPVIDLERKQGQLPIINNVAEVLSDINYSVFLYGWVSGIMTISSNRTVVKQIEATVEKHRNGDDDLEGPLVWVCETPRSLIGKEKDRRE